MHTALASARPGDDQERHVEGAQPARDGFCDSGSQDEVYSRAIRPDVTKQGPGGLYESSPAHGIGRIHRRAKRSGRHRPAKFALPQSLTDMSN
jgi:hypothetical protein